jgi:hypothetical protein
MLDLFGRISWFGAPVGSVITFVCIVYLLRKKRWWLRAAVALPYAALVLAGMLRIVWAIALRDGLGPDAISTSGGEALRRALPGMMEGGLMLMIAASGVVLMVRRRE